MVRRRRLREMATSLSSSWTHHAHLLRPSCITRSPLLSSFSGGLIEGGWQCRLQPQTFTSTSVDFAGVICTEDLLPFNPGVYLFRLKQQGLLPRDCVGQLRGKGESWVTTKAPISDDGRLWDEGLVSETLSSVGLKVQSITATYRSQ
jgi:hypothetical protein